ncbi:MAG: hypothetical protein K6D94_08150 [Clostridiales bacterium]|nr:hypothetical protein [Clostridiales bacterium]
MTDIFTMLSSLTGGLSASGFERSAHEAMKAAISPYFDDCETLPGGGLIFTRRCPRDGAPTVMLDTHLDEIGLMVSDVTDEGMLRVEALGGVDLRTLPASDVTVYGRGGSFPGVIAAVPPHLTKASDRDRLPDIRSLLIDTGYDRETMLRLAPAGTPIGYVSRMRKLLDGRVAGRGFDDKACAAIVLRAMEYLDEHAPDERLGWNVAYSLASGEETGETGAAPGARAVMPDAAIILDVGFGTAPDVSKGSGKLGGGPVISLSAASDRYLTNALIAFAEEKKIPYRAIVEAAGTGTDGDVVNTTLCGIPAAVVSLPLLNMHTQSEIIDMSDIETIGDLIGAFIAEGGLGSWYAGAKEAKL